MSPEVTHQARLWSARLAWLSGAVALFVPLRVSFFGFSGAEGPGSCGTVSLRSFLTLWHTADLYDRKAICWLNVGRVSALVAIAAVVVWRVNYSRDTVRE